jgi:hypothetical protein
MGVVEFRSEVAADMQRRLKLHASSVPVLRSSPRNFRVLNDCRVACGPGKSHKKCELEGIGIYVEG